MHLAASAEEVKYALLNETLILLWAMVSCTQRIEEFGHSKSTLVYLTEPLQNRIVIFNTAKAPTNDLRTRKSIIHAVDKASIIEKELGILAKPVNNLFPQKAPYCDVELTPRWDYDMEKARLLNCESQREVTYTSCGVQHTLTKTPSRVVTMNQGVTEFMLAMGLADKMVGTAYLDDAIWPKYAGAYSGIPVLSSSYPDEATLMSAEPDFLLGSYASAYREKTCTDDVVEF